MSIVVMHPALVHPALVHRGSRFASLTTGDAPHVEELQDAERNQDHPRRDEPGAHRFLDVAQIHIVRGDPQECTTDQDHDDRAHIAGHSNHHPTAAAVTIATTNVTGANRIAKARPKVPA